MHASMFQNNDYNLLGCDPKLLGKYVLTFRRFTVPSSSQVKQCNSDPMTQCLAVSGLCMSMFSLINVDTIVKKFVTYNSDTKNDDKQK